MKATLVVSILLLLASCRSQQPIIASTDRVVTQTEVIRKVNVITESDTAVSVYRIVPAPADTGFAADNHAGSKTQPVMLEKVGEKPGKYVKAPKITVRDGQLVIAAVAEPQTIPVEVKDTYMHERESKTEIIVKNELNTSQKVRVWIGNIVIALFVVLAIIQVLRVKKVLKF